MSTLLDPWFITEVFSTSSITDSTTNEVRNAVALKTAASTEKPTKESQNDEEERGHGRRFV